MLRTLWLDESGAILCAELAVLLTLAVLTTVAGLSGVAVAVNIELNHVSNEFRRLCQSFRSVGFFASRDTQRGRLRSYAFGSIWSDGADGCDSHKLCDVVCGVLNLRTKAVTLTINTIR